MLSHSHLALLWCGCSAASTGTGCASRAGDRAAFILLPRSGSSLRPVEPPLSGRSLPAGMVLYQATSRFPEVGDLGVAHDRPVGAGRVDSRLQPLIPPLRKCPVLRRCTGNLSSPS